MTIDRREIKALVREFWFWKERFEHTKDRFPVESAVAMRHMDRIVGKLVDAEFLGIGQKMPTVDEIEKEGTWKG